jgi:serine/threonine-protein kinase RIO1
VACCRTLFQRARLVHGDLSEYNLLLQQRPNGSGGACARSESVRLIDLGQAVDLDHPQALELLHRDLTNVLSFFGNKRKVAVHSLAVCKAFVTDPLALLDDGAHEKAHLTYGRSLRAAEGKKNGHQGCGGGGGGPLHRGGCGDEDCISTALDQLSEGEEAIDKAVRTALFEAKESAAEGL